LWCPSSMPHPERADVAAQHRDWLGTQPSSARPVYVFVNRYDTFQADPGSAVHQGLQAHVDDVDWCSLVVALTDEDLLDCSSSSATDQPTTLALQWNGPTMETVPAADSSFEQARIHASLLAYEPPNQPIGHPGRWHPVPLRSGDAILMSTQVFHAVPARRSRRWPRMTLNVFM
jgi:hypothetical protein